VLRGADPTTHPHPIAASATYVAPPAPGRATVHVCQLKTGRTFATFRAELRQGEQGCVQALVTLGTLPAAGSPPVWMSPDATPPPILPLAECVPTGAPRGSDRLPVVTKYVEQLLEPTSASWATGEGSGRADIRGWVRMISNWDPVLAQFILADSPPPVTFDLGRFGWLPTLTLQVLLRQVPRPGWHRFRQHAITLAGGTIDEDCTLWAEDGSVVSQARQLAAYRD